MARFFPVCSQWQLDRLAPATDVMGMTHRTSNTTLNLSFNKI